MSVDTVKLSVPLEFRRGSLRNDEAKSVASALKLLDWVEEHKKVRDARILDFGCGVKVGQALYQKDSPQRFYVGLDVYSKMISYMDEVLANDPKYRFHTVPFQNDMYNPTGEPMKPTSDLGIGKMKFDIQLMFSVITHMKPDDSFATLSILRRYIAQKGKLLFWAFSDPDQSLDFFDQDPTRPLLRAKYKQSYIEKIIEDAGWSITSRKVMAKAHRKVRYICEPTRK